MNFETKYLIRWGVPGWIMILTLFPFLFITFFGLFDGKIGFKATDILTLGAALTVIGVPLGYILNQVHHSLFWVIPHLRKKEWEAYFKDEIKADEKFLSVDVFKKERYAYLLSKKHELGGVAVSLTTSWLAILLINIFYGNALWSWIYFAVVTILTLLSILSRNYTTQNVHYYFYEYLLKDVEEN